jgi:hypothetical protein
MPAASPRDAIRAQGYWDTQSGAPTAAPGTGKYRADSWSAPTLVAVNVQDADGYQRAGLAGIVAGDVITQLATNNSQNYQRWTASGPAVDNTTWVSIPVTVTEQGTTFVPPGSNQRRLLEALSMTAPDVPPAPPNWTLWAPPLDPPAAGGLPENVAQAIADATWAFDPHLCAALQWEAYAGMLPPTPAVATVSTGAQSVSYQPPLPTGDFGLAMARASYHRSLMMTGETIPCEVAAPALTSAPGNPWAPLYQDYSPIWPVA